MAVQLNFSEGNMKNISVYSRIEVCRNSRRCVIDGKKYKTKTGRLTFYVLMLQVKWFCSSDSRVVCLSEKIHRVFQDIDNDADYGLYTAD